MTNVKIFQRNKIPHHFRETTYHVQYLTMHKDTYVYT